MVPIRLLLRRISCCHLTSYHSARTKLGVYRNYVHTSAVCCGSKSKKSGSGNVKKGSDIDNDLKEAAKNVADSLPGDSEKTAAELLSRLRIHATATTGTDPDTTGATKPVPSLGDLFSGMKIESPEKSDNLKRSPSKSLYRGQQRQLEGLSRRGLFDGPPLGIFQTDTNKKDVDLQVTEETLWDVVEREELEELMKPPVTNGFEEMIRLTEEGKLWHFPINNEQGMEEEAKYEFHDHIFFEDLLEDFPKKGPVRHFMELVTTGLSQNPCMTVPQKREHIQWFREYFKDKQHILDEAMDSSHVQ